jgi:hypothetical protein
MVKEGNERPVRGIVQAMSALAVDIVEPSEPNLFLSSPDDDETFSSPSMPIPAHCTSFSVCSLSDLGSDTLSGKNRLTRGRLFVSLKNNVGYIVLINSRNI